MPSPTAALETLRPDLGGSLEEFDLAMDREGFIGLRVLPVFETRKQSGVFGKIKVESLLRNRDTKRHSKSGYARDDFDFTTESFATEEHGAESPVDDREAELYAEYFDAELLAAERARDVVLRNHEKRVADAVFDTGTFTPTTLTNEWDDATNATPIADVEAAVQRAYDASGLWPNALIITRKVFRNLRNVDEIVDRLKYQGFVDVRAATITAAALAQVFDLEQILVAGGTKNSANEGQDATFAPIWSDEYAMITRIARSRDIREPCLGRTFHWAEDGSQIGTTMESYREPQTRSDVVRHRHDVQEKLLHTDCAELLDNVTT